MFCSWDHLHSKLTHVLNIFCLFTWIAACAFFLSLYFLDFNQVIHLWLFEKCLGVGVFDCWLSISRLLLRYLRVWRSVSHFSCIWKSLFSTVSLVWIIGAWSIRLKGLAWNLVVCEDRYAEIVCEMLLFFFQYFRRSELGVVVGAVHYSWVLLDSVLKRTRGSPFVFCT